MTTARRFLPPPPTGTRAPRAVLAWAVGGSALIWFLHLLVAYALVPIDCEASGPRFIPLVTVAGALAALSSCAAAVLVLRRAPDPAPDHRIDAVRFLARFGLLLGAIFVLAIVLAGSGSLFIHPCRAPA